MAFFARTLLLLAAMAAAVLAINAEDAAVAVPPPPVAGVASAGYLETHSLSLETYLAMPTGERAQLVSSSYPSLFAAVLDTRHDSAEQEEPMSDEDAEELMAMLAIKYGSTGPWAWLKCKICQKSIGFFVGKVTKYGCGKVTIFSSAICEIAGLGPADPLSSICIAAVVTACLLSPNRSQTRSRTPTRFARLSVGASETIKLLSLRNGGTLDFRQSVLDLNCQQSK